MTQIKATATTPGYRSRLAIFFQVTRNGQKCAYRWEREQLRSFRIPLADAENWIAQGLADRLDGHPLKTTIPGTHEGERSGGDGQVSSGFTDL